MDSPALSPDALGAVFTVESVDMDAPAVALPMATPAEAQPQTIILPDGSIALSRPEPFPTAPSASTSLLSAIVPGGSTLTVIASTISHSSYTAVPSTTLASLPTSPALLSAHDTLSVDVADETLETLWLPDVCTCDTDCEGECECAEEDYEAQTCVWPDDGDDICTWSS